MAFITTPHFLPSRGHHAATARPQMALSPPSIPRRAALRLAAVSLAGAATAALAGEFDLEDLKEDLKEDVEELNYEEELTDIGPDPVEKQVLRTKKKVEEPKYRVEEEKLIKKEGEDYDAMVAKQKEENARLKAQFSKE